MPSLQTVVLPSRAFFLSWKTQTIPARKAALEDALEHYREAAGSDDHGWQDMALLGLISEAMQLLEDLAYLAMAWDKPFTGLANYVRATVYSSRTPTNFWGEVPKWTDERLEVFAGLAGTNPDTGKVERLLEALSVRTEGLQGEQLEVMERARVGTVARLRRLLPELAKDWNQFSRYFQGFKHGALAISRDDIVWVDDAVEDVKQAEKHEPTVAVWMRRGEESTVTADFASSPDEIAEYVMGSGRMAAFLVEAFIESRLPVFDAVAFEDDGSIRGLRTLQIPWTIWLREEDLDPEDWKKLGRGPLLKWIDPPEPSDSPPPAQ
jgi:hypothetical protein